MNNYIGITLGPIYETLTLTSTPAGLWAASYMFSYTARNICQFLIHNGVPLSAFISPRFKLDHNNIIQTGLKGVGLFHDRIIISAQEDYLAKVKNAISKSKDQLVSGLTESLEKEKESYIKEFVENYMGIYFIEAQCDNPLIELSCYLDGLELQVPFYQNEKENYILSLFDNKETDGEEKQQSKNASIKRSFLVNDSIPEEWPLLDKDKKIKDLKSIANAGIKKSPMKKHTYYAVVQADGDNMGEIIKSCKNDEERIEFSEKCFDYILKAVPLIKNYGGITIYAGGDDLLFLAPVENDKGCSIFELLQDIEEVFGEVFMNHSDKKPSLSFGVSICYYKYPLYEAFSEAVYLLFDVAKKNIRKAKAPEDILEKNSTAINIKKHSGQNFGLVISRTKSSLIYKMILELFKYQWEVEKRNEFLRSVAIKTNNFKVLFIKALREEVYQNRKQLISNLFDNIFDSKIHMLDKNQNYINQVKELLLNISETPDEICSISHEKLSFEEKVLSTIDDCLRILKFFVETGKEEV
ncbi:UNVERIFIED_CONTAM: CRISPR-associated protein Cmr2 [Acetivibrio alkalicellulosi]